MAELNFQQVILDRSYIAYERDVGDIDGDGDNDLVAVQEGDTTLQVFRAPTWARSTLVAFTGTDRYPRADDFKLADIDGDGDLDAVTRLGPGPADDGPGIAVWCENLGGGSNFTQRLIGKSLEYVKDIVVADCDRDGHPDVAMRMDRRTQLWFQNATNWTDVLLTHAPHEGMEAGDLDMDGDPDLILNGFWFLTPDTPAAARVAANYTNKVIDAAWFKQTGDWTANSCKVVLADFDGDGTNDVAFSQSERAGHAVTWYRSPTPRVDATWSKQTVAVVDYCHNLQAVDWDLDGDVDLLVGGMIQSKHRGLKLMLNSGAGTNWNEFAIQSEGSYSAETGDIDNDGDLDIVGIRNWNSAPTWIYRNHVRSARLDSWTYHQVSAAHVRTFGLCLPDMDGDGDLDIASGPFVYLNPGAPLTNAWTQVALPNGVHAFATLDVDGDNFADLLAQKDNRIGRRIDLFWVEATNVVGTSWATPILVGNVPRSDHAEGFQGYRVAQLVAGGRPEIAVSTVQGVYYFAVPETNPAGGNWPRTLVVPNDSDENVGVADIEGDGDLDLGFTTGASKQVKWARNPGDGRSHWSVFAIGASPEADWPDRCEAADLNGDGRVDIVVTEENSGKAADALACWWEQPASGATNANWPHHTIATQYTMNNLDLADVDQDGDIDLVLAEHRGTKRIAVWENDGLGVFAERRVGEGHESHLGGRLADLDGDGDLDLVSIAYDDSTKLHLWCNDNVRPERNSQVLNEHVAPDPPLTRLRGQSHFGAAKARPSDTLSPPTGEGRGEGSAVRFMDKATGQAVASRAGDWGVVKATLGDSPAPSGDPPDGMASSFLANPDVGLVARTSPISAGESPTGAGESPALPNVRTRSEVRLTENAVDESADGVPCYRIETPTATYFLEKVGAGLASMIDKDGHDWLGFEPTPGSRAGGEFRGFPNAVDHPAGSYFHAKNAGTTHSTTKVEHASAERLSISAVASNGLWACRYDFFPAYCTFTMTCGYQRRAGETQSHQTPRFKALKTRISPAVGRILGESSDQGRFARSDRGRTGRGPSRVPARQAIGRARETFPYSLSPAWPWPAFRRRVRSRQRTAHRVTPGGALFSIFPGQPSVQTETLFADRRDSPIAGTDP